MAQQPFQFPRVQNRDSHYLIGPSSMQFDDSIDQALNQAALGTRKASEPPKLPELSQSKEISEKSRCSTREARRRDLGIKESIEPSISQKSISEKTINE